jgi:hypothetical protein
MNVSRLFVIAMLVGTVGVFGCSDDENGTGGTGGGTGGTGGGTGGTGGGGTGGTDDACVGPLCNQPAPKEACNELIGECNTAVQLDIPEETCDLIGNQVFCEEGAGGNGGNGGNGGSGDPDPEVICDVLGCQTDGTLKAKCEVAVQFCIDYCLEDEGCQEDECAALGLLICNVTGG